MNLKHLRYFWTVAQVGGISRAAETLNLTPQTISGQIRHLEEDLGAALFRPAGRGLELTEAGRQVLSYADEILHLSGELKQALSARQRQPIPVLRIGITDVVPKTFAYRLLAPVGKLPEPVRLVCREGTIDMLLAELALQRLDMVVADRPMPSGLAIRGHSHKLGESPLAFFGGVFVRRTWRFSAMPERCAAASTGGTFRYSWSYRSLVERPALSAAADGRVRRWCIDESFWAGGRWVFPGARRSEG